MAIDWSVFNPQFGQQLGQQFDPVAIQQKQNALSNALMDTQLKQMQVAQGAQQMRDAALARKQKLEAIGTLDPEMQSMVNAGLPIDKAIELSAQRQAVKDYQAGISPTVTQPDYAQAMPDINAGVSAIQDRGARAQLEEALAKSGYGKPTITPKTPEEIRAATLAYGASGEKGGKVALGMQEFQDRIAAQREAAKQAALDRQEAAKQAALDRENQIRLAAGLRPAPAEKQVAVMGKDGVPILVPASQAMGMTPFNAATQKMQQSDQLKKQTSLSTQQVLDQAATLFAHPGRQAATGMSSFLSKIPGTDARGFQANLDTFKAQTFIPMVSALKGMGALSDAEGRKLSESVGALDPAMPEAEFEKSLKDVTKYLYDKAQASGLDVQLPDFASSGVKNNSPTKTKSGGVMSLDDYLKSKGH